MKRSDFGLVEVSVDVDDVEREGVLAERKLYLILDEAIHGGADHPRIE